MIFIKSYSKFSKSARALNKELNGTSKLKEYAPQGTRLVVGWGSTASISVPWGANYLNRTQGVRIASDKLKTFSTLKQTGVSIPEFTTKLEEAVEWAKKDVVFGRKAKGSGGADICPSDTDEIGFLTSEFWTKYIKKKHEFRVHVMDGKAEIVQRKALRVTNPDTGEPLDTSQVDFRVRNLVNGFVFTTTDVAAPDLVLEEAVNAVKVLGLHFGAVDVVWNEYYQKAYVLEVNTAPGLEGDTILKYVDYFKKKLEEFTGKQTNPPKTEDTSYASIFNSIMNMTEPYPISTLSTQCDCEACLTEREEYDEDDGEY